MKRRIKLALKILLGYNIVVYEEQTKIVKLVINGNLDLMDLNIDYDVVKGHVFKDNNGELRYFGNDKDN